MEEDRELGRRETAHRSDSNDMFLSDGTGGRTDGERGSAENEALHCEYDDVCNE